jgi:ABC-type dipeptide/oligopeptide/nickel transport system permease subunit
MVASAIDLPSPRRAAQESQGLRNVRRLLRHRGALIGAGMILIVAVAAIPGPLISPHDPADMGVGPSLAPPSLAHPFGTDTFGRGRSELSTER